MTSNVSKHIEETNWKKSKHTSMVGEFKKLIKLRFMKLYFFFVLIVLKNKLMTRRDNYDRKAFSDHHFAV